MDTMANGPVGPERSPEGRSEGSTGPAAPLPEPELVLKPKRRQFSASYKAAILEEAVSCAAPGELGALLRREGLYSSHLAAWRRQAREFGTRGLSRQRGRKPKPEDPSAKRVKALEQENRRLKKRLEQAELIIDFQKKVSTILGITLSEPPQNGIAG
jgi:transposase-like protein